MEQVKYRGSCQLCQECWFSFQGPYSLLFPNEDHQLLHARAVWFCSCISGHFTVLFQINFINMSGTNYFCNSVPLFFEMSFIRFAKIVPSLMTGLADSHGMAVEKKQVKFQDTLRKWFLPNKYLPLHKALIHSILKVFIISGKKHEFKLKQA